MPRVMLALPPLGDWEDNGPVVFSGIAEFRQKEVQNAGRAFFDKYEYSGSADDDDDDGESDDGKDAAEGGETKKKKGGEKKERDNALKLSDLLKGVDLYVLMECDEGASQDDVKKSYRKLCLTHHPDKQAQPLNDKEKEKMNQKFLKLQEAYEILSDTKKRRKYDSMGDFDDRVPSDLKKGQDFFDVFGAAFKRNSKWSERKPVPDLGDADMPWAKVDKFYEFWRGFQSWRDLDEKIREENDSDCFEDLDQAECREHRRMMERQNQKLRAKAQKNERARILRLLENAEKFDPRVIAEKERKRLLREAEKAEKDAKRAETERLVREEKERKEAIERDQEEARKAEKAKKDEERQAKKVARAQLRKQIKELDLSIMEDQLQEFLLGLESEEIKTLTQAVSTKKVGGETVFKAMRAKGLEPIIMKVFSDDEQTTASDTEEQIQVDPEKRAELERLAKQRQKDAARKAATAARKAEERDLELKKIREEEAIQNAEEKKIRDAKKKVENEKKDQERRKSEKKAAEDAKKKEEKKLKTLQQDEAKAIAEKLANKQQAEAMKSKAQEDKEEAEQLRQEEHDQMEFERDRLARSEELEKLEWPVVVERSTEACALPEVAGALAAIKGLKGEELLDAQLACLGSIFVLGVRLDNDSPGVSSTLRSRMKKLRAKLRTAAAAGEFSVKPAAGAKADIEGLVRLMRIGVGLEMEAKPAPPEAAKSSETSPKKKAKAKAKAKAGAGDDEDLDALLAEFNVEIKAKKPKKQNKK